MQSIQRALFRGRCREAATAAVLVLAAASAEAAGTIVDIAWSAEGRFRHAGSVPAGQFVEVCGSLAAGNEVRWGFEATAPVDFNIHYHVGKEAEYPARMKQVTRAQKTLRVAEAHDYCWMWANKGRRAVKLSVELRR